MPLKLACCVEAPALYLPRAQYAMTSLLIPLGIRPDWVERDALHAPGIYYGPNTGGLPAGICAFHLSSSTLAYFESSEAYNPANVSTVLFKDEEWPLLFEGEDLFATTFFWLSGWQEHTQKARDQHGRFPYKGSLQDVLNLSLRPLVDACREMLAAKLTAQGVRLNRPTWDNASWVFCPTHDIDYLWKWRPGMVYRESVQYLLMNRLKQSVGKRFSRFGRFAADLLKPGDVFRGALKRIQTETARRKGRGTYFFKAGAHGPHDVAYSLRRLFIRRQFRALKEAGHEMALHPSYYAHDHAGYLEDEKRRLEDATGISINAVRQHYLRYHQARTPRLHAEAKFTIDSTLAFAERPGFRRGTCHPFQLFDIHSNRVVPVWEMPLSVMDGTLFNRQQYTLSEAQKVTNVILKVCKRYQGCAIMLWHNTLWDELDFPNWGAHFEQTLFTAVEEGAVIRTLSETLAAYQANPN